MKKMRKAKVITVVALAVVMLAAMTGIAAAAEEWIRFEGTITDSDGNGVPGVTVEIKKNDTWAWNSMGTNMTNSSGHYNIPSSSPYYVDTEVSSKADVYRLYISNTQVDEQAIDGWESEGGFRFVSFWSTTWSYEYSIPEFATIAIPVAAILGLVLFFNHRKRKRE